MEKTVFRRAAQCVSDYVAVVQIAASSVNVKYIAIRSAQQQNLQHLLRAKPIK